MSKDEIKYKQIAKATEWLPHPDDVATVPDLIGRVEGVTEDMESVRSETSQVLSVGVPFNGAAIGVATVSVFESKNVGDEGGLVFRISIRNDGSAFQPHAVLIEDGVDLHIAGDEEATALLSALQLATSQALRQRRERNPIKTKVPKVIS